MRTLTDLWARKLIFFNIKYYGEYLRFILIRCQFFSVDIIILYVDFISFYFDSLEWLSGVAEPAAGLRMVLILGEGKIPGYNVKGYV